MWKTLSPRFSAVVLVFVLVAGCAGPTAYLSQNFINPQRVALLPISNETTDLDGPPYVRQLIFEHLAAQGYILVPLAEVDDKLKEQGFTDGGQLGAATPQKLGEWIGADTLFYTTLENFDYISIGFYSQRRVKILGKAFDAKTGERLWEAERDGITRVVATNKKEAERQFAIQMGIKMFEKTTHHPLQLESRLAVRRLLETLRRH